MTGDASAGLYPQYCLHLSPTFNTWCALHASDIHALRSVPDFEVQDFYFYKNLPIKWVRIVGIVVAVEDFSSRRIYTVDDSSGACIECVVALRTPPASTSKASASNTVNDPSGFLAGMRPQLQPPADCVDVDVGSVLDIKGGLTTFREEMQIKIEKVKVLRSTEQEVALWERRTRFRNEVLLVPWVLSERQIRRCKKEEMRESGGDTEERKRKKEKRRQEEERCKAKEAVDAAAATAATSAPVEVVNHYRLHKLIKRQKAEEKRVAASNRLLRQVLDGSIRGKCNALGF